MKNKAIFSTPHFYHPKKKRTMSFQKIQLTVRVEAVTPATKVATRLQHQQEDKL